MESESNMPNKDDKIHIKLEIRKDKASGELMITAHFDPNAPNFAKDKNNYFWWPTVEEKNFFNEVFELVPTNKTNKPSFEKEKTIYTPPEKKEEKTIPKTPPPTISKESVKPLRILSPFERKIEKKPISPPPLEKKEEAVFEVTEGPIEKETIKEEEDRVLTEADEEAIERALEKDKDTPLVEADEQTIIDKVLNQKKKGKWSKK